MLVSCLSATLHISNLLAENSVIDLGLVLNGFGFSIQEACATDDVDGQCWLLSILFALKHSQKYRSGNGVSSSHDGTSHTVLKHLNQPHLTEIFSTGWQPAHQLNALLAQEESLTILTIEVSEQGLLHIVLTIPSDTGYEQQVIFFGGIENLFDSELQIAQTLQQLLLSADISLVFTSGHVQPVILMQNEHPLDELDISLPVHIINSPARMMMLSEIMSYSLGSEWRLRPDFNAHYGAIHRRAGDQRKQLKDVQSEQANKYQKHKVSERRWRLINRSVKAVVTTLVAGAGYFYREPITRFIQPYWSHRAYYYDVTTKTLSHWGNSLKVYSDQFMKTASPYLVSARTTGRKLLNRYYWQQDDSTCVEGAKVSVLADDDNHYRTEGIIAGQSVDLLIDSGATFVSMSARVARKLGFSDFVQAGTPMRCNTASHRNVKCYKISLPSLQVGCIKLFNLDATVMESENDEILLGMSFLSRLNWNKKGRLLELQLD